MGFPPDFCHTSKMNTTESKTTQETPVPEWFKELLASACERKDFLNALFYRYQHSVDQPSDIGNILFALRVKNNLPK